VRKHRHTQPRNERQPPARKLNAEDDSETFREQTGGQRQRADDTFDGTLIKPLTETPDSVSGKPLTKAKVLVVHGTGLVRSGVLWLIAKSMQFVTCGETDDAPTARELFLRHKPALVVLGLTLRGGDGIQLIKDFRNLNPAVATVVLSGSDDALSVRRAFRAGARGYLSIDDSSEMLRALDEISNGRAYVSAGMLPVILESFAAGKKEWPGFEMNRLSDRELEIFSFIGRGFSVSQLAIELHVSVKTIETHQMRMKEKLALRGAAELRQKAREWLARSAVNRIREDPEPE
jgi:DNA-binding NarL/FixJ family response regulator